MMEKGKRAKPAEATPATARATGEGPTRVRVRNRHDAGHTSAATTNSTTLLATIGLWSARGYARPASPCHTAG